MEPPYYAVIFTTVRTDADHEAYGEMAEAMERLAEAQPGYLGIESARAEIGITVSYWRDLDAIRAWKRHIDHIGAQKLGRDRWYARYRLRIAKVERDYSFEARH